MTLEQYLRSNPGYTKNYRLAFILGKTGRLEINTTLTESTIYVAGKNKSATSRTASVPAN